MTRPRPADKGRQAVRRSRAWPWRPATVAFIGSAAGCIGVKAEVVGRDLAR
jgi:hypothetical protein